MMQNILIRKKRFFAPGGSLTFDENDFEDNDKPNPNKSSAINTGLQFVNDSILSVNAGINNTDKGKYDSIKGLNNNIKNYITNTTGLYTAGMNDVNLLNRTGLGNMSAKDLKDHKGIKNVLNMAVKGAGVGSSIGTLLPGVGTAIGTIAGTLVGSAIAGVGEFFGWKKRKRQAKELSEENKKTNFAVDYYNGKQYEQLASANNQAAKTQADLNRQSVLGLMAYGGKRNRNILLNKYYYDKTF